MSAPSFVAAGDFTIAQDALRMHEWRHWVGVNTARVGKHRAPDRPIVVEAPARLLGARLRIVRSAGRCGRAKMQLDRNRLRGPAGMLHFEIWRRHLQDGSWTKAMKLPFSTSHCRQSDSNLYELHWRWQQVIELRRGDYVRLVRSRTHLTAGSHVRLDALHAEVPGLRRVLDCDLEPQWAAFRRALVPRYSGKNLTRVVEDMGLVFVASGLAQMVSRTLENLQKLAGEFEQMLKGNLIRHSQPFCMYGYITAVFVMMIALMSMPALEDDWQVVKDNIGFCIILLGKQHMLDYVSSSSWPVDWLDLIINTDKRVTQARFLETFEAWSARKAHWITTARTNAGLITKAGLSISYNQTLQLARNARFGLPAVISVVSCVTHPSFSLQLPTLLAELIPMMHLRIFCDSEVESSYAKKSMCSHVCSEFPHLCSLLRTDRGRDSMDAIASSRADLVICEWYTQCISLVDHLGPQVAVISYYAGAPWNSYRVRDGLETVEYHLNGFWALRERDIFLAGISPAVNETHGRAFMITDGPLTSEVIRAYTGISLPFAAPLSVYLKPRHVSIWKSVLIMRVLSTSGIMQLANFPDVVQHFAAYLDLPYNLETSNFVSWENIVRYTAVVYFPHGWMSMTFHELYSVNIPLLLPDRNWLISQVMLNALTVRCNDLWKLPRKDWAPPVEKKAPHPYSSMLLGDAAGPYFERQQISAALYWGTASELLYYPHILRFESLPGILVALSAADFPSISRKMASLNRELYMEAARVWPLVISALLPVSPVQGHEHD